MNVHYKGHDIADRGVMLICKHSDPDGVYVDIYPCERTLDTTVSPVMQLPFNRIYKIQKSNLVDMRNHNFTKGEVILKSFGEANVITTMGEVSAKHFLHQVLKFL